MKKAVETCYVCGAPKTSKEHVPPKSWFAKSYRQNLMTVPSCAIHNESNSSDVEYVGFILAAATTGKGSNELWSGAIKRNVDRRRGPFATVMSQTTTVQVGRDETGEVSITPQRFVKVLAAIGYGLYYYQKEVPWKGRWRIVLPDPDDPGAHVQRLSGLVWIEEDSPNHECFQWWSNNDQGTPRYKLKFYGELDLYIEGRIPEVPSE